MGVISLIFTVLIFMLFICLMGMDTKKETIPTYEELQEQQKRLEELERKREEELQKKREEETQRIIEEQRLREELRMKEIEELIIQGMYDKNYTVGNHVTMEFLIPSLREEELYLNTYYNILSNKGIDFNVVNISKNNVNINGYKHLQIDLLITIKII